MKKIITAFSLVLFGLLLAGCTTSENRVLEDDLNTILETMYAYEGLEEDTRNFLENLTVKEVEDDRADFHMGSDDVNYSEAIASVPSLGTAPFEVTLIRASRNADIEAEISEIESNINPMKWVSFGVEPENIVVDNIGDVIIIIMSDDHVDEIHEAFLSLQPETTE